MTILYPIPPLSPPGRPETTTDGKRSAARRALTRYYGMMKPGIVLGNTLSVTGGFMLATRGRLELPQLLVTVAGLGLVVASACVVNNYIDRDIDRIMRRTSCRAMVTGAVSPPAGLAFAAILGVAGIILLAVATNLLATALAGLGFVIYVFAYTLMTKRRSVYGTAIGSLAGAMPPVVGYCAVSGRFDLAAALLLATFALWQMPHSYAIAILRLEDYAAAGIPVLPVVSGVAAAKRQTLYFIVLFVIAALWLAAAGLVGRIYVAGLAGLGLYWLGSGLVGWASLSDRAWARRMFVGSIVVVSALSVMLSIDATAARP